MYALSPFTIEHEPENRNHGSTEHLYCYITRETDAENQSLIILFHQKDWNYYFQLSLFTNGQLMSTVLRSIVPSLCNYSFGIKMNSNYIGNIKLKGIGNITYVVSLVFDSILIFK